MPGFRHIALTLGIAAALLSVVSIPARAQGGLAFLKVDPSAEALAVGSALTSTSRDAFSAFINPAGLAGNGPNAAGLTYNAWIGDAQLFSFAGRFRLSSQGGIGVALTSSASGDIEGRSQPGPASSTSSATFLAAGAGYGHQIGPIRFGLTGKYLLEQLFDYHASGFAVDLGVQTDVIADKVWLSAAAQNLGDMQELNVQQTSLPSTYRVGAAFQPFTVQMAEDGSEPVLLFVTAEYVYRDDEEKGFAQIGGWIQALDFLWIRGGYLFDNESRNVTLGLGLQYESVRFDYAYLPFSDGFGNPGQVVTLQYFY